MFFDGGNSVSGGWSGCYDQYKTVVNTEIAKGSFVIINGTMTVSGSSINLSSTVSNTGSSPIANVELMVVLFEDIGTAEHHYVVRDILTPSAISSLAQGTQQQFNMVSDYRGDSANLKAVLFLRLSSRQILQAVLVTQ
jgi:hypothetical protein